MHYMKTHIGKTKRHISSKICRKRDRDLKFFNIGSKNQVSLGVQSSRKACNFNFIIIWDAVNGDSAFEALRDPKKF